jgi:hypothetical protein
MHSREARAVPGLQADVRTAPGDERFRMGPMINSMRLGPVHRRPNAYGPTRSRACPMGAEGFVPPRRRQLPLPHPTSCHHIVHVRRPLLCSRCAFMRVMGVGDCLQTLFDKRNRHGAPLERWSGRSSAPRRFSGGPSLCPRGGMRQPGAIRRPARRFCSRALQPPAGDALLPPRRQVRSRHLAGGR